MPSSAPALHPLEVADGICRVHPAGMCTLLDAVDLVRNAIAICRERGIDKLLFDATALRGVPIPTLVDRFLMVEEWAQASASMVTLSLVVHAEYIHPQKFGVVLAHDLGLACDVHTSREEALRWLATAARDPPSSTARRTS